MSTFDLTDFASDKDDSSSEEQGVPAWVDAGSSTTQKLYKSVVVEYSSLVDRIEKSNTILSINERRIVNQRIADQCGVNKSTITKRRQPDIADLINDLNDKLSFTLGEKAKEKKDKWNKAKKARARN